MKARQKRRQRRITTANVAPSVRLASDDPLALIQQLLTEQRRPLSPDIMPELEKISGAVMRIDRRIDAMESRVIRQGAISGGLTGALSGGLVVTTISLIKAKMGF
ncbi:MULTISPECIES: hypothetical protein [Klebsiella]|uniref:hypothetical protein n=1 Tax=Klebsiella TaxID=570 RepID=UPI0011B7FE5B|nr:MULTISPECIES: hypothetical protein [Klebsiella]MBZ7462126.1 hypothetical protein [Klebsiella michiganensis]TWV30543.1 hypothetical protein FRA07_06020 [Klebsiella quasipneumoniae subsp. similipneumoniae]